MNPLTTVLCAYDFGPCSGAALAQALRIARRSDATVRVLHVVERTIDDLVESRGMAAFGELFKDVAVRRARALERIVKEVGGPTRAIVDVRAGSPSDRILEEVESTLSDLLVMGLRAGDRPGAGPVATAAVRHSAADVLLVREGHEGPFRTIIACVDFSETSRRVVAEAHRLAARDGAALRVVHVRPEMRVEEAAAAHPLGLWPVDVVGVYERWARYVGSLGPALERFVAEALAGSAEPGPRCDVVEHAHYGPGIVRYCRQAGADLCVIGTRGRSGLRYALLGSTAERVVRETECSLLAVRPATRKTQTGAEPPGGARPVPGGIVP